MQCQGKKGSWRKRTREHVKVFIKYCWLLPASFFRVIKISPGTGTAAARPRVASPGAACATLQSPHGLECALGAGSTTSAATFGQRLFRFASRYFHQNTTAGKTDISTNYNSIFFPESYYNLTGTSPFWPYMEIKYKIAKDCESSLPSLSFPLPWNWDDVYFKSG